VHAEVLQAACDEVFQAGRQEAPGIVPTASMVAKHGDDEGGDQNPRRRRNICIVVCGCLSGCGL
jgi:hypothetical protein